MDLLYTDHLETLRRRTDAALARCGYDALAIYAGGLHMQFLDDQPYPFKANPHFKQWVPLREPLECWLAYQPGERPRLVFLQPLDYWYKPPALPQASWSAHFSIEVIRKPEEARRHLCRLPRCAFIGEWRAEFDGWGFVANNPEALLQQLHFDRARKTPYELACMRQASLRGARGHLAAQAGFLKGLSEYEIHLDYLRASGKCEAELPYPSIVAMNENAAVLHYQQLERSRPAQRRSFLIDAGAEFGGYAVDITRTYAHEDGEFEAIIEAMHALQLKLCDQVRSGVDYVSIHLDAHLRIASLLRESGLIKMPAEDAVASGVSSLFFPHGVGHLLGLQVHDVAGHSVDAEGRQRPSPAEHPHLRLTRTLEPGYVVTIEPGLYLIEALLGPARSSPHARHIDWQLVDRLRPFGGVRIEDDVVCTENAPENLTRPALEQAAREAAPV